MHGGWGYEGTSALTAVCLTQLPWSTTVSKHQFNKSTVAPRLVALSQRPPAMLPGCQSHHPAPHQSLRPSITASRKKRIETCDMFSPGWGPALGRKHALIESWVRMRLTSRVQAQSNTYSPHTSKRLFSHRLIVECEFCMFVEGRAHEQASPHSAQPASCSIHCIA